MNHAQRRPRHWFTRLTHPSYSLTHSPVEDLAVPQPGDILVQVLLEQVHQQEAAGRRDLNGDQSVVMDGQRLPKARFARVMNRSVRGLLVRGSSTFAAYVGQAVGEGLRRAQPHRVQRRPNEELQALRAAPVAGRVDVQVVYVLERARRDDVARGRRIEQPSPELEAAAARAPRRANLEW